MMRRRAAEINLLSTARPHMKKNHMPDGIKHHGTEQCDAVRVSSRATQWRQLVMIAESQGVTVVTSTAAEVRRGAAGIFAPAVLLIARDKPPFSVAMQATNGGPVLLALNGD